MATTNTQLHALRVLILDAHSNAAVACLQSIARAGHETWLAGKRSDVPAWHSKYGRRRFIYPDPQHSKEAFIRWLRELDACSRIDFILPVTDATLHPLMEIDASSFGARIILPPQDAFAVAFDKSLTMELARQVKVPTPSSRLINSLDHWRTHPFDFPLYLKPVVSKVWRDSEGASLVPALAVSEREMERELARMLAYGAVLVQEYVSGDGIGVEVLCDHGEVVWSFAHQRLHELPLTGGASTYRISIPMPEELYCAAARLMERLGWHGVAMIEFKRNGDRFWLMEINGRFWGSLPLAIFAGVDFPRALIDLLAHGQRPTAAKSYRVGVYARNLVSDLFWQRANARADKTDAYRKTRSTLGSLLELGRVLSGKESWDHFSWRDPGPGVYQLRQIALHLVGKSVAALRRRLVLAHAARAARAARNGKMGLASRPLRTILVLCHGNVYRSPFVCAYLRAQLPRDQGYRILSSGFHSRVGRSSPPEFVALASRYGVDLEHHRSSLVNADMIAEADLILIMDTRNYSALAEFGPAAQDKTFWLGAFADDGEVEIRDPYGSSVAQIESMLGRIVVCVGIVVDMLNALNGAGDRAGQSEPRAVDC